MNKLVSKVKHYLERFFYVIQGGKNANISKVILREYLPSNPVIIDCGACDGSDSVALAKLVKMATIHSFEPVDQLYTKLIKKTKRYNNITCYPIALADRDGIMDFYLSSGSSIGSSSLLEPKEHLKDHPETYFIDKITVSTRTLDSWAKENNIKKVDMLWLDMQGYELKMLKASKVILESVSVIHTEVSTRETYKDVEQYNEYRSFLEEKGFSVRIEAIPKGWDMGNVLFVKDGKF